MTRVAICSNEPKYQSDNIHQLLEFRVEPVICSLPLLLLSSAKNNPVTEGEADTNVGIMLK